MTNLRRLKFILTLLTVLLFSYTQGQSVGEKYKISAKMSKKRWLKSLDKSMSGLKYKVLVPGTGVSPRVGNLVTVHYIGIKDNDTVFENTYDKENPLVFNFGVGQVIKGWDEGLSYLKEGGKAILVVPPKLGYGKLSTNKLANSTLYFIIELIHVDQTVELTPYKTLEKDTVSLPNGIKYIVVDSGKGAMADTNSWAYIHFTGYLPKGKIFDSSYLRNKPVRLNVGKNEYIQAWDDIVKHMRVGARYHIIVPPDLGYGIKGLPGVVPPNTTLEFDIELVFLSKKKKIVPFDTTNKDTVITNSGIKFIVVESGNGEYPKVNDIVRINFSGYFTNGKMFQSTLSDDSPIMFAVGQNQVIKGLDEVVKYMQPGSKFRVIIPWKLGYGEEGYAPVIPPKQDLIFDIELIGIVG